MRFIVAALCLVLGAMDALADGARARDLGIPFEGEPGPLNAITDVHGVAVGQVSIIEDFPGGRAARTGVTAILPLGRRTLDVPVFAGWFALNGNGEMTGTAWIEESGFLEGPVMITNTHSVGTVHRATIEWRIRQGEADAGGYFWSLPVVAETWDGYLNDINGFHVRAEHVFEALEKARDGPVEEGAVGGGTGMICHEYKCGIGTSSRRVVTDGGEWTVGVLVQANYGRRETLQIAGVPVGVYLAEDEARVKREGEPREQGSIIVVVATDAPLVSHQLKRLARRAALGLARAGGMAGDGSGDLFLAFSTANAGAVSATGIGTVRMHANATISPLFDATVLATEEAIINSLVGARDMVGDGGRRATAIDHGRIRELLRRHRRLDN